MLSPWSRQVLESNWSVDTKPSSPVANAGDDLYSAALAASLLFDQRPYDADDELDGPDRSLDVAPMRTLQRTSVLNKLHRASGRKELQGPAPPFPSSYQIINSKKQHRPCTT